MRLDVNSAAMLVDEITATLERVVSDFDARIEALENGTGVHILNGYDEDRTDYPHNQLAKTGGGALQQWDANTREWRVVVNTIEAIDIVEADGRAKLKMEKTDGTVVERFIPFAKAPRQSRTKPVKVTA